MNLFSGIINMMGEPVIVWRASSQAKWEESRKRPRGKERNVYSLDEFGAYDRQNREPVNMFPVLAAERASSRKRESGEIREAGLMMKVDQPIYTSDNSTGDYADIVEARGEYWKIIDVTFDRVGGLWKGSLRKLSDDQSRNIGVGYADREYAT